MVTVAYKGESLKYTSLTIKESVHLYASEITVKLGQSLGLIEEPIEVNLGNSVIQVSPVKLELVGSDFIYTCYPTLYLKYLKSTYGPAKLRGTIEDITAALGLDVDLTEKTQQVLWIEEKASFRTTVDRLAELTSINGGGGAFYTVRVTGKLTLIDLGKSIQKEPVVISGDVLSAVDSIEWMAAYPLNVSIRNYDDTGEPDREPVKSTMDVAGVITRFATEDSNENSAIAQKNKQYRLFYTSKKVMFRVVGVGERWFSLGAVVDIDGKGSRLVITEMQVTFALDQDPMIILELSAWSELLKQK